MVLAGRVQLDGISVSEVIGFVTAFTRFMWTLSSVTLPERLKPNGSKRSSPENLFFDYRFAGLRRAPCRGRRSVRSNDLKGVPLFFSKGTFGHRKVDLDQPRQATSQNGTTGSDSQLVGYAA